MKHLTLPLLVICFLLASCAGRTDRTGYPLDPGTAQARWQTYVQTAAGHPAAPYRISMSMRFGREGDTRRVTALFWGNGERYVRLDVQAGVGATVAMVAQKDDHFLIHAPLEQRAYFQEGSRRPLLKIGVPLPFDLFHLEAILNGRYTDAFGTSFEKAGRKGENFAYALTGHIGGTLFLDARGVPAGWEDDNWTITFAADEDSLVRRMDLKNRKGDKGVVIVKERARPASFTQEQMTIHLPEDTVLRPLENYRAR